MTLYTQRFSDYGAKIGQLLLTHDVFDYPMNRQHVLDTIDALLAQQVIPVINENDSVAVDELDHRTTFGDNDQLSALVANKLALICWSSSQILTGCMTVTRIAIRMLRSCRRLRSYLPKYWQLRAAVRRASGPAAW